MKENQIKRKKFETNENNCEQIQQSIYRLAQAFANGFFTEVNCKILPENFLDELAHQVYQFVLEQSSFSFL